MHLRLSKFLFIITILNKMDCPKSQNLLSLRGGTTKPA